MALSNNSAHCSFSLVRAIHLALQPLKQPLEIYLTRASTDCNINVFMHHGIRFEETNALLIFRRQLFEVYIIIIQSVLCECCIVCRNLSLSVRFMI